MSINFQLVRSVLNTPGRQLFNRLTLMLKRHTMVAFNNLYPGLSKSRLKYPPPLAANPLVSVWDVHRPCVLKKNGHWQFTFLNEARELDNPISWHANKLNTGTRLWKIYLHSFDWVQALSDEDFIALCNDWLSTNRPYKNGYWSDSWNSFVISVRVVTWMAELARRQSNLPSSFRYKLEIAIFEQLRFLKSNIECDIGGNHLVKNIKALCWGSRYFSGKESKQLGSFAEKLLARQLDRQILPDGFHFELSPPYHTQVFCDLIDIWRCLHDGELKCKLNDILKKMAQVITDMTHPDGMPSLFNDGGLHMTHKQGDALKTYTTFVGLHPEPRTHALFPNAGYYVFNPSGFKLIIDSGRVGPDGLPAHAHGDILAFELSVGTKRLFVDAGVYEYNAGPRRTASRSTMVHNTVTIDNRDQCEFWGSFRMGRRANVYVHRAEFSAKSIYLSAEHDGYSYLPGRPIHRRIYEADAMGKIQIMDVVEGGKHQLAKSHLLLHPSVSVEMQENILHFFYKEELLSTLTVDLGACSIEPAVWWPDFGVEEQTKKIVINLGEIPTQGRFRITVPYT